MHESLFETQLNTIVKETKIINSSIYSINGEKFPILKQSEATQYFGPLDTFGKHDEQELKLNDKDFIPSLSQKIYAHYYCGIAPQHVNQKIPSQKSRNSFMDTLSAANFTSITPDKNWEIYAVDANGNAYAKKNGELRTVIPNTYEFMAGSNTLAVHQKVNFYRQKENREFQPIFYHVFGDTFLSPESNMIRIYWNIKPEGAATLVYLITKTLNNYHIPFNFKCLNHPDLYFRNDSAVLYFDKSNIDIVHLLVKEIIPALSDYMVDRIPLFTAPLYKGVSIAEDPGNGQSFGMSRATAIAEGILQAFEKNIHDQKKKNIFVRDYLSKKGMSHSRIFLNPHTQIHSKILNHA